MFKLTRYGLLVAILLLPATLFATMRLQDGNLICPPYNCTVTLGQGESLTKLKGSDLPIFVRHRSDGSKNYYFYSNDIIDLPAYSGKPIGVLAGMDEKGTLVDARLISHHEPILLVGIPEKLLKELITGLRGWNVREPLRVDDERPGAKKVDVITGATVTALVATETVRKSARAVAISLGILDKTAANAAEMTTTFTEMSWRQMLDAGMIGHLRIEQSDMGLKQDSQPWLDIYYAPLRHPMLGRNLLGDSTYKWLMRTLKSDETAILVLSNGKDSIKGSGFVRGGIFDRFHLEQGLKGITFRDLDYENLYELDPEGVPDFKESGIFTIRDKGFVETAPFDMVVLASRLTGKTARSKVFHTFRSTWQMPDSLLQHKLSMLEQIWQGNRVGIAVYILLWLLVIGLFVKRRKLAANEKTLEWVHLGVLATCLVTIGLYQKGQPSVVNILTLFQVIKDKASFAVFFQDPYLAVGWIFIAITLPIWGRPLFCGWICPYGALQEILFKVRKVITRNRKSLEFPAKIRRTLKPLRYLIFITLLCVSFASFQLAEIMAEIEPFKTTWNVGVLHRSLGFGIYWSILILAALATERFFCRYLCPLGAALSLASRFPFLPIPRRNYCTKCVKCAKGCSTYAIDTDGKIDNAECLGCFECIEKMDNDKKCPPLISVKIWNQYEAGEDDQKKA